MDQSAVMALLDRQLIVDVLCRYASALDAKDYTALRTVFADDVEARYGSREPMHGVDEVVEWIAGYGRTQAWQHHLVSVYHVTIDDEAASALTYMTATQAPTADPGLVATTVGAYHDDLRRIEGAWQITRRTFEVKHRESHRVVAS